MSRKYKMNNLDGTYFVSFATVYWIDVFTQETYFESITQSLAFCRKQKGMILYGYCIMPIHIHLLFQTKEKNPTELLQSFQKVTVKIILKLTLRKAVENSFYGCLRAERKALTSRNINFGNIIINLLKFIPKSSLEKN